MGDDRDRNGAQLQATAGHGLQAIPAISWEAGREDSAMGLSGGHGSSTVLTSDFWPPDLRKHIPIGLSTPVCGNPSWQLEEISVAFKLTRVNPAHHFPLLPSFLRDTGMCAGAGDRETSGDCYMGCTLQPLHPSKLGQSGFLTLW